MKQTESDTLPAFSPLSSVMFGVVASILALFVFMVSQREFEPARSSAVLQSARRALPAAKLRAIPGVNQNPPHQVEDFWGEITVLNPDVRLIVGDVSTDILLPYTLLFPGQELQIHAEALPLLEKLLERARLLQLHLNIRLSTPTTVTNRHLALGQCAALQRYFLDAGLSEKDFQLRCMAAPTTTAGDILIRATGRGIN